MVSTRARAIADARKESLRWPPRSHAEAGAAVWTGNAGEAHFQVAANLPAELSEALELHPLPTPVQLRRSGGIQPLQRQAGGGIRIMKPALRKSCGKLRANESECCRCSRRPERAVAWQAMLDQMAQLAAVAIENSLLYERLAFQAQHDTLTGLPNRLLFQDRVQQAAAAGGTASARRRR